jgi:hypothetical protein
MTALRAESGEAAPRCNVRFEHAIVFCVAFAITYVINFRDGVFIWSLSQQEGGMWIDEAYRMLNGELIYRDFFDFLAPGTALVNTLFLWALGATTTSVGLIVVTLGTLIAVTAYAASAALLSYPWRLVPTAIFLGLTYPVYSPLNHKWPTILLCTAGILVLLRARSRLRCATSGILLAGATLCTQDFGVGAAIGMAAALWLLRRREPGADPLWFVLGYGATMALILTGLGVAAGFGKIWYDLFAFLFEQYGASHMLAVGFGGEENLPIWLAPFGLGMLGLGFTLVGIARRFWRSDDPALVIIALAGSGLLVIGGVAHPIEPLQVGTRAVPLSILGVYTLQWIAKRRIAQPLPVLGVIALGAIVVWHAVAQPIGVQFTSPRHLEEHRAGKIWAIRAQDELDWLEANTVEGQPVFLFPDKAGLYFLSRTRNATSYPIMLDIGFNSDAQVAEAIAQIGANCPMVGVWHRARLASYAGHRPDWFTLEPLWQAIERDYDAVSEFSNGATALRRKPGAACRPSDEKPPGQ